MRLGDFLKDETGAITVEWIVLAAAITGLGLAVQDTIESGKRDLAETINANFQDQGISYAVFVLPRDEINAGLTNDCHEGVAGLVEGLKALVEDDTLSLSQANQYAASYSVYRDERAFTDQELYDQYADLLHQQDVRDSFSAVSAWTMQATACAMETRDTDWSQVDDYDELLSL